MSEGVKPKCGVLYYSLFTNSPLLDLLLRDKMSSTGAGVSALSSVFVKE